MFCPNCGRDAIPPGGDHCPVCDEDVEPVNLSRSAQNTVEIDCPNCDRERDVPLDHLTDASVKGYNGDGEWAILAHCNDCGEVYTLIVKTEETKPRAFSKK